MGANASQLTLDGAASALGGAGGVLGAKTPYVAKLEGEIAGAAIGTMAGQILGGVLGASTGNLRAPCSQAANI
jgi:hypothetical protein